MIAFQKNVQKYFHNELAEGAKKHMRTHTGARANLDSVLETTNPV
jgi:hypothetical protein